MFCIFVLHSVSWCSKVLFRLFSHTDETSNAMILKNMQVWLIWHNARYVHTKSLMNITYYVVTLRLKKKSIWANYWYIIWHVSHDYNTLFINIRTSRSIKSYNMHPILTNMCTTDSYNWMINVMNVSPSIPNQFL